MLARRTLPLLCLALALALPTAAAAQSPSYVLFESGPVRPLALSPSGDWLVACNVPNGELEIFQTTDAGLRRAASVEVGMEPIAVSLRQGSEGLEAWVVNHLSDSVSIVDLSNPNTPQLVRTLLVGDEPRDVVFAGSPERAFVTTAHRGQHRTHPSIAGVPGAGDPELTTEGVPRADVWVFDAEDLDQGGPTSVGGIPVEIVELFGDTPRPLAVSPDGSTVYAGVFKSGNQTTTVGEGVVCDGFNENAPCNGDGITSPNGLSGGQLPGGLPGPAANHAGVAAPEVGLIVEFDEGSGEWRGPEGRNWSNGVRFFLPDHDVFAIDANTLNEVKSFDHVGTTLFNMAVNPVNGNVYVTNTEAENLTRFEGTGQAGGSSVNGNLAHTRVTVLSDPLGAGQVSPRHLNRHIDYGPASPAPPGTEEHSLSTPVDTVVSSDGQTLYVAAFGSQKVGVLDTADLEDGTLWDGSGAEFDPTTESADDIALSGGGPAGLALDEARERLYVLTRFDNSVAIVDLGSGSEQASLPLTNPEPASVVEGRPMLYDAVKTSSNGEASCASCHIFGDKDELAWDLGDPDADVTQNPMPINLGFAIDFLGINQNGGASTNQFHPMKGPMTTQTLKGLANSGAMHWRGDRASGFFGTDQTFNGGSNDGDEALSFNNFIVAFNGLLNDDVPPTNGERQANMQQFTAFALQMTLPPNPVRGLDNSLGPAAQQGREFFLGNAPDGANACSDGFCNFDGAQGNVGFSCEGCHELDPSQGFFGTGTFSSFENETQIVKIPHLRNLYTKVGMFGMPDEQFFISGNNQHKGGQVRGFGFLHDGSTDSIFRFLKATVFQAGTGFNQDSGFDDDSQRLEVEQFMLAFPSDLAPVVGQQVSDDGSPAAEIPDLLDRRELLKERAGTAFTSKAMGGSVTECDLVVSANEGGEARGWLYDPQAEAYEPDRASEAVWSQSQIDALASASMPVTYTCVPPGSGVRVALDEDEDGVLDGDERDAGTDVANAGSLPGACSDGIDNDGDGVVDLADPGCRNADHDVENPACSDGVNNDSDGLADFDGAGMGAADPQCPQAWVKAEVNTRCGLGFEVAPALGLIGLLRRRRRRSA